MRVLGVSYGGSERSSDDCLSMLDDLAARPETAQHICRKLVRHFISDTPPDDVVKAMVAEWTASKGNLAKVYAAMLNHPRAWSDPGMKMKLPFDYVVSGLRALGIDRKNWQQRLSPGGDMDELAGGDKAVSMMAARMGGDKVAEAAGDMAKGEMAAPKPDMAMQGQPAAPDAAAQAAKAASVKKPSFARIITIASLRRMGQPVWQPPSPAGFEEGVASWLSPSQLSERILWARKAASTLGGDIQPSELLKTAMAEMARDDTIRVVQQAPNRTSGITLALSSPEFNRR